MRLNSFGCWVGIRAIMALMTAVAFAALPATGARTVADLRAEIQAHLTEPRFAGALWSVKIASLETGQVIFEEHPAARRAGIRSGILQARSNVCQSGPFAG